MFLVPELEHEIRFRSCSKLWYILAFKF